MAETIQLRGNRQLFVDDLIEEETRGLQRVLNQPSKYAGNPVISPIYPWERGCVDIYGTVIRNPEDGAFRMWYQGFGGSPYSACYATSKDGIFWERPNLGLIEYNGSTDNNLFMDDASVLNVIDDARETDPARRYKSLFFEALSPGNRRGEVRTHTMSVAFSPDGLRWTKYEGNPVLTGVSDVHTLLGWDDLHGRYVAYPRPGLRNETGVRVIGRSVSDDFTTWTKPEIVMAPDDLDPPGMEFYGMPVFKYEGLYLGMAWAYHTPPEEPPTRMQGTIDVQLASSRDGIDWQRTCDRATFIPLGPRGSIDQAQICTAKEPVRVDDELWIYHGAVSTYHGAPEAFGHSAALSGHIFLSKLRLDGFVSQDAGAGGGTLLTKPFTCPGGRLSINAAARGGSVAVAVLDPGGTQVPGYSAQDCAVFDGDSVRHHVTWRDAAALDALAGQPIRLKFYLRTAKLYSFGMA